MKALAMKTILDRLQTPFFSSMFGPAELGHLAEYDSLQKAWEESTDIYWRLQVLERLRLELHSRRLTELCCQFITATPLGDGRNVSDLLACDQRLGNALRAGKDYADGKSKHTVLIEQGIRATDAFLRLCFEDTVTRPERDAAEVVCLVASASGSPLLVSQKLIEIVDTVSGGSVEHVNHAMDTHQKIIKRVYPVVPTPPYCTGR